MSKQGSSQKKIERRPVDGILLLNKSYKLSSNTALQQVKRLYNAKKAGHTGSLDPLATGVLPICLGEATKFSSYLLDADKIYTAWGRLGYTSPTGDAEGELVPVLSAPIINLSQLQENLKFFIGSIKQIPPVYSALKKDGVPLYKLARESEATGQTVDSQILEDKARWVTILDIQLNHFNYPDFEISVHCSKGTYIRTLVEDIGKSLNSGAYLLNLRRDKAGPYSLEKSYSFEQLQTKSLEELDSKLLHMDSALQYFPAITLELTQIQDLRHGKVFTIDMCDPRIVLWQDASTNSLVSLVRLYNGDNIFIGLGRISPENELSVQRLVAF
jgi:tRNA pseudouridine55 synthase